MKFLLFALNGSYAHTNLAIRCLRDALEREADPPEVEIFEAGLRDRTASVLARLTASNADVYGFSCYIWNITEMTALAEDLKKLLPSCRIFFGGPEVTFDAERFTSLPFVDTVITGEGEAAICRLYESLRSGKELPRLFEGGVFADFPTQGNLYKEGEAAPLVYYESSRGCPFSCAFCLSSATEGVREKTVEKTLSDLAEFEKFTGPLTVKLVDRTFNANRERAKKIWRGLLSPAFTKCYHFEICADLLDEESFEILAAFPKGKVRLEIGLQSTNPKTLAAIGRRSGAEKVLAAAARLHAAGNCHLHLDLIAGLPFEDMASFGRSFDAAVRCCDVLQLGFLKFLHGTRLRAEAESFGAVYSTLPPYTVLKTDSITFEELQKLGVIADVMDRLFEKERFKVAADHLFASLPSPFTFLSEFADHLAAVDGRELQKISQREFFTLFGGFGSKKCGDSTNFLRLLEEDFNRHEARRPPVIERSGKEK